MPDVMHPVHEHIEKVCADAYLGVMVQVYEIVSDRGVVTEEALLALTEEDVNDDYFAWFGPAIDKIERRMEGGE